ncbi:MAG: hypothetical protein U9N77_00675 [Thermodesulfobacteriota bacterium]|nr:hypothetical protein [Thermodesulfobacteriota bacterium]
MEWTSENAPIPPFGFWDFSVGANKTIGGYVLFGKTQGKKAGEIALKRLTENKFKTIVPFYGKTGRFYFSKSQLKKWGISLTKKIESESVYTE